MLYEHEHRGGIQSVQAGVLATSGRTSSITFRGHHKGILIGAFLSFFRGELAKMCFGHTLERRRQVVDYNTIAAQSGHNTSPMLEPVHQIANFPRMCTARNKAAQPCQTRPPVRETTRRHPTLHWMHTQKFYQGAESFKSACRAACRGSQQLMQSRRTLTDCAPPLPPSRA